MGLYRNLYFMSLVGATAGLFAWLLSSLIGFSISSGRSTFLSDLVAACLLGGLIGGLTIAFGDHRAGNPIRRRFVLSGIVMGIAAGLAASLVQFPINQSLSRGAPFLTRVMAWMIAGAFIGCALGLRWVNVNRARPLHAFCGGMLGGAAGGMLFASLGGRIPDLSQAVGFMCIGIGICAGITLAPILLKDGILQFVSSGDLRAQSKFGPTRREWEIQNGDTFVIGSESQTYSSTKYRPEVEIFIPDAAIANRHATVFAREGRFYLARHADIATQAGLAKYVLRVHGRTVVQTIELSDSDDLLIGRTALRFVATAKKA